MSNTIKRTAIALLLAGSFLFTVAYWVLRLGFGIDLYDRSGWYFTDNDQTQLLDHNGKPLKQWQVVDGDEYYFDDNGYMVRGWLEENGAKHYFSDDGTRHSGWLTVEGDTYYCTTEGILSGGWCELSGSMYYFDDSGVLQTGWIEDGNDCYLTDQTGIRLSGKQNTDRGVVWLDSQGRCQYGWITEGDKTYYLHQETGVIATGWQCIEEQIYYFDPEGILVTGWLSYEDETYYLNPDGEMVTGWNQIDDDRYYFLDDGTMYRGWLETEAGTYYLKDDGTMAIGQITLDGTNHFFTSQGKYVLLVNPWNPVPENYELNLVDLGVHQIDAECFEPLLKMLEDCEKAGYSYRLDNIYRSVGVQQYIWNQKIKEYMEMGYDYHTSWYYTGQSVAIPGHSEHQTGLAADILGSKATYAWLREHCWEYGFILRYPENKIEITGIIYEPWHFRYVGTELAKELYDLDLCMEEYMQMLTEQQVKKESRND